MSKTISDTRQVRNKNNHLVIWNGSSENIRYLSLGSDNSVTRRGDELSTPEAVKYENGRKRRGIRTDWYILDFLIKDLFWSDILMWYINQTLSWSSLITEYFFDSAVIFLWDVNHSHHLLRSFLAAVGDKTVSDSPSQECAEMTSGLNQSSAVSPTNDSSRALYLFFFFCLACMRELHHSPGPDLYRITGSL